MLTGAPPDKSIMDAISQQQFDACIGCLLSCGRRRVPMRRLVEVSELSGSAQAVLRAFTSTPEASFTVADARAHTWLDEHVATPASSWLNLDPLTVTSSLEEERIDLEVGRAKVL